jgi:hypothetical protein
MVVVWWLAFMSMFLPFLKWEATNLSSAREIEKPQASTGKGYVE